MLDRARELAAAALANLEAHRGRIDDLNVYPVPDGDTGTNLTLTVRAVVEALGASTAADRETLAQEVARAALLGARGNSGVILSQVVRGFADALGRHDELDGPALAAAFRAASDAAYGAVRHPVEGTMLTVARELAEEAELPEVRALPAAAVLARVVERGDRAVARTPEQLAVLAEAGVVDAGGAGLVELVRGLAAAVGGAPLPAAPVRSEPLPLAAVHLEESRYRYCTVFVVEREEQGLDLAALEGELEALGDSLLVVGDEAALKVHVHTDDPGAALSLAARRGTIDGVEIANMRRQAAERAERLAPARMRTTAVVAVVAGEGNERLVRENTDAAAVVVRGGPTMNPSADELRRAIEEAPGEAVIVLPNNGNVLGAAEIAAREASKPARVVPTRSLPGGIAAVVAFNPEASLEANETAMCAALEGLATGEIAVARRSVDLDGVAVRQGAWFGLVDERAVACDESFDAVVDAVLDRLLADGERDLVTALVGAEGPDAESLRARLLARHPDVEVDVLPGGQPHYPLLLGAE